MSAPLPTMPDSWHLEPPHRSHGHHLSSDPWDTNSPAGSSTPIPIPTHYPNHPAPGPGIQDALGALARNTSSDRRKGKEREREVMELVRYEAPVRFAVMGDMMDTSKGRDKVLKCVQYSLKTYLYLLSLVVRIRPLSRWFLANRKRVTQAVSSLSLTRKCLILLTPLHPLSHLLSPSPTSAPTILRHLMDLASGISDDLFCLSRLGLVSKRLGASGDKWSNRLWFTSTVIALYKLHLQTLPRLRSSVALVVSDDKAQRELSDAEWTNRKLLADLIFSSYDVFHLTWFAEPVKCFTGLAAGIISTTKIYDQHWRASLGKG
ncbi:uncharacterized protein MKK02DRAFT_31329 [Dioszegia hungarica]|uniref:Peroxisomal biogenesis factor 11 n=1 Tax=Dioszegia hungarica TaxID=4972 RepID=A0AA38HF45_9TREE|nr:uncharacterized protein MKK02DRAFT_31329 [Dioszegia hungarica]KAI9637751.1 hypothetical protein MKK02DRAFT_31329 [Dioszegia hungarica]